MIQTSGAKQIGEWACYSNPSYCMEIDGVRMEMLCDVMVVHKVEFLYRKVMAEAGISLMLTPVTSAIIKQNIYARTLSSYIDVINPPGLGYIQILYAKGYGNGR